MFYPHVGKVAIILDTQCWTVGICLLTGSTCVSLCFNAWWVLDAQYFINRDQLWLKSQNPENGFPEGSLHQTERACIFHLYIYIYIYTYTYTYTYIYVHTYTLHGPRPGAWPGYVCIYIWVENHTPFASGVVSLRESIFRVLTFQPELFPVNKVLRVKHPPSIETKGNTGGPC